MTTLAQELANSLARHIDHSFGLMGNGNAHLIDALARLEVPYTAVRHEAATVASADAYTRVSGKLSLATTTYGAGFTNTLTALAEASQARTPLLLVVGDAPSTGKRPWDIDQEMAAAAVGVRGYELDLHDVAGTVDRAVASALRKRRPVVLGIPYDLATQPILRSEPAARADHIDLADPETVRSLVAATMPSAHQHEQTPQTATTVTTMRPHAPAIDQNDVNRAVSLLTVAERPLVLAGHGAWVAEATEPLNTLAEQLGALTATTALGRGIFTDERSDLGITGGFGQPEAMAMIKQADVVLVVGAALNQFTMRFGDLLGEGTAIVRVDIDPVDPPRSNVDITHLLLRGDARDVVNRLIDTLQTTNFTPSNWRSELTEQKRESLHRRDAGTSHPEGLLDDGRLDPRAAAVRLAELLPRDRHVTSDGGHFIGWANMYWPVESPERMIMVGTAFQTIGLGLASVAGVAAAAPQSTVVLTTGDGGALMSLADLETAIRTAASCVIVVWNDAAYSAEVHLYGTMGLDETPMRIPEVNFAGLATALGARGVVVRKLSDLAALAEWTASGSRGTLLLDLRVSGSVVAPYQREVQRVNGLDVSEA